MAKHQFGIMQNSPQVNKRYDNYEPHKYNCISVDDDYLTDIIANFDGIEFYWHSLNNKENRINYCGITLIPPSSMQKFYSIIKCNSNLDELKKLFLKAYNEDKWIIHFGL